jgi:hypothetical protein
VRRNAMLGSKSWVHSQLAAVDGVANQSLARRRSPVSSFDDAALPFTSSKIFLANVLRSHCSFWLAFSLDINGQRPRPLPAYQRDKQTPWCRTNATIVHRAWPLSREDNKLKHAVDFVRIRELPTSSATSAMGLGRAKTHWR